MLINRNQKTAEKQTEQTIVESFHLFACFSILEFTIEVFTALFIELGDSEIASQHKPS